MQTNGDTPRNPLFDSYSNMFFTANKLLTENSVGQPGCIFKCNNVMEETSETSAGPAELLLIQADAKML